MTRARIAVAVAFAASLVACAAILGIDDRGAYEEPVTEGGPPSEDAAIESSTTDTGGPDAQGPISTSPIILVRQGGYTTAIVEVSPTAPSATTIEVVDLPQDVEAIPESAFDAGIADASADAGADAADASDAAPPAVDASVSAFERRIVFTAATTAKQGSYPIRVRGIAGGGLVGETTATLLVAGPAGSLDLSFGTAGIVYMRARGPGDEGVAIATQADGKIVVAVTSAQTDAGAADKDFVLVRFHSDGGLDDTFGTQGVLTTDLGTTIDESVDLVQLDDGRLIVGGRRNGTFAAARYFADGGLDPAFGDAGVALHTESTWFAIPNRAAVQRAGPAQTTGTIIVAGGAQLSGSPAPDQQMVRFKPNGAVDFGFGQQGVRYGGHSTKDDQIRGVAVQADGKIVSAGYYFDTSDQPHAGIERCNNDGTNDTSFTNAYVPVPGFQLLDALALQSDGKSVAAGYFNGSFYAIRAGLNGGVDPTFDATKNRPIGIGESYARAIAIDPAGNVLLAGWALGANRDVAVMRLDPSGAYDPSFGQGGKVVTPVGAEDQARAIALQPDGRILVTGFTTQGAARELVLLRYWQ